jgi:hypothetical protein
MNEDIVNAGFDSSAQSPEPEQNQTNAEQPAPAQTAEPEPDPAQVLWQALNEDPIGTISFLAQHYGWQPAPPTQGDPTYVQPQAIQQQPMQQPIPPNPRQMDPWQQLLLNVALRMWQSEAAAVVKSRAQEDGLELSDQDLQSIFLSALEKFAGDIDSAYAAYAYPRLKARASQKQQSEEKEPESGDLMSSIIMAGYR